MQAENRPTGGLDRTINDRLRHFASVTHSRALFRLWAEREMARQFEELPPEDSDPDDLPF